MTAPRVGVLIGVAFVGLALIVTSVTTTVGVTKARADLRDAETAKLEETARAIAAGLASVVEGGARNLEATSALITRDDLRPEPDDGAVGSYLDPLLAYAATFDAVHLVDVTGRAVVSRPPLGAAGFADSPAFESAVARRSTIVTLGDDPAAPAIFVTVPATRDDPEPFFLVGEISANRLRGALFAPLSSDDNAVYTAAGRVVAATDPRVEGRAVPPSGPGPAIIGADADAVITVTVPADEGSSVTVFGTTVRLVAAERDALLVGIGTGAGLIIGSVVAAAGLSYAVSRPLAGIMNTASRMRRGDLTARAEEEGPHEVRELARGFNTMAMALERDHDELLALQRSLENRVRRRTLELEERNRELDDFAQVVSHDLKSPLRAIQNLVMWLQEDLEDVATGEAIENLRLLRQRSSRLSNLVDAILAYSRAGRSHGMLEMVAATDVVDEAVAMVEVPDGFNVERPQRGPRLHTERVKLQQVLQNLIANAIVHHDADAGAVRVSVEDAGSLVRFVVEDDGPGIPAARRERVFELFAGGPASSHSTGVGLAVVKKLVDQTGGSVWIEDAQPRGTRVVFTWPKRGRPLGTAAVGAN